MGGTGEIQFMGLIARHVAGDAPMQMGTSPTLLAWPARTIRGVAPHDPRELFQRRRSRGHGDLGRDNRTMAGSSSCLGEMGELAATILLHGGRADVIEADEGARRDVARGGLRTYAVASGLRHHRKRRHAERRQQIETAGVRSAFTHRTRFARNPLGAKRWLSRAVSKVS